MRGTGIKIDLYMRYMDDGRKMLQPIKVGWRWEGGTLMYCKRWALEDAAKTPLELTVDVIRGSLKGIIECLEFTVETGDEFEDGCAGYPRWTLA